MDVCTCDRYASLHDALLSCSQLPGSLVVTAKHFVLTSLISGKAFGCGDVICQDPLPVDMPWWILQNQWVRLLLPPSFPNPLAVPQTHKTHMEKCPTDSDRNVLWGFTPSHFLKLPHVVVSFPQVSDEKAWSPELKGAGNWDVYNIVSMLVLEAIPHVSCLSPAPWLAS